MTRILRMSHGFSTYTIGGEILAGASANGFREGVNRATLPETFKEHQLQVHGDIGLSLMIVYPVGRFGGR